MQKMLQFNTGGKKKFQFLIILHKYYDFGHLSLWSRIVF